MSLAERDQQSLQTESVGPSRYGQHRPIGLDWIRYSVAGERRQTALVLRHAASRRRQKPGRSAAEPIHTHCAIRLAQRMECRCLRSKDGPGTTALGLAWDGRRVRCLPSMGVPHPTCSVDVSIRRVFIGLERWVVSNANSVTSVAISLTCESSRFRRKCKCRAYKQRPSSGCV